MPTEATDPVRVLYASPRTVRGFENPWQPFRNGILDLLRWQLSRNAYDKRRRPEIPRLPNAGAHLGGVEHSAALTWVGHASFAVHDDADVVLTDPHFGPRALLPRRQVEPGVPLDAIPAHAFAVVSHNHYDHLDAYTVKRLPAEMAWFVPLGLGDWFRARGRSNVRELGWWESTRHGRWTLTCLPSQHWSARIEQPRNSTLWCSWLLQNESRRYFFAGDSGYFPGFAEFGRRFGPIDVALLPIGAYEPRWFMRFQHMDPFEAWQAFLDLGARFLVPMHWGTFDLTDEPLDLPPQVLMAAVERAAGDPARVKRMAIGERWRLPGS